MLTSPRVVMVNKRQDKYGFIFVKVKVKVKSLSRVQLFATPWNVAHQAPLSMEFFRQEYWNGLPFPSDLTQGSNLGLPCCRQTVCHLSHHGSTTVS